MIFIAYVVSTYVLLPLITLGVYYYQIQALFPAELLWGIFSFTIPGVFLYFWFMSQFITGSRVKIIEKSVGLPTVMRLHVVTTSGIVILTTIHALLRGLGSFTAFLGLSAATIFVSLYILAITLWVETLIHRIPFMRKVKKLVGSKVQYKHFRLLHNINALGAVLVFWHIMLSNYFADSPLAAALLVVFFVISFGSYLYHKLLRPLVLRRRVWKVVHIQAENEAITTIEFEQVSGKPLTYKAGQFGFFRFISGALKSEEHPFSFSSASNAKNISITVQKEGDFTKRLRSDCALGDLLVCDAPYGSFCIDEAKLMRQTEGKKKHAITFIAGGIGVTPFLGILADLARIKNNAAKDMVSFHWLSNTYDDAFGKKVQERAQDLVKMRTYSRSRGTPLCEKDIVADPDYRTRAYYICASSTLTRSIIRMLHSLGISKRNIHYELFAM